MIHWLFGAAALMAIICSICYNTTILMLFKRPESMDDDSLRRFLVSAEKGERFARQSMKDTYIWAGCFILLALLGLAYVHVRISR